jgi:hypothetical protein
MKNQYKNLKSILDNLRYPQQLDDHPWTMSLQVVQATRMDADLAAKSPGYQLVMVVSRLFCRMMPSTPPRKGKRLDTSWCQFGILAAEYFGPFLYGTPFPSSLRDAGGRIDLVLPYFVFGKSGLESPETEQARYWLFADSPELTPISTLSDWLKGGTQRLAELFMANEESLSLELSTSSPLLPSSQQVSGEGGTDVTSSRWKKQRGSRLPGKVRRWIWITVSLLLIGVVACLSAKAYQVAQQARLVEADLRQIQALARESLDISTLSQAATLLATTRQDLSTLETNARPYLWMGKWLAWAPTYGGDLAQAGSLLDLASNFVASADEASQGMAPFLALVQDQSQEFDFSDMTQAVVDAQPKVLTAEDDLNAAMNARNFLDVDRMSPKMRTLITDKVDPVLTILQDGLAVLSSAPKLLGASSSGPQTYLLIFQNEDELRATGGFLTAVGTVVVEEGKILSFQVENSYDLDDLSKPYPPAPRELEAYMSAQILLLRDANWSPDFPTTASLVEYLYAYTRYHSVDGIVAVDQHAIQMLLSAIGSVEVEGADYPITSKNAIGYMRQAKYGSGSERYDSAHRKDFIEVLGGAILSRLQSGQGVSAETLFKVMVQVLNERHILVQVDDPSMQTVLAGYGWDGAIQPGSGDFLMVVDSNVGFTKSNAVVDSQLIYQVDLSDPAAPSSRLQVTQKNNGTGDTDCMRWSGGGSGGNGVVYEGFINRCYWDYMRVYTLADTQLLDATPHAVPGDWMLDGANVPAHVDTLAEGLPGIGAYGTLFALPLGASLETDFDFKLPPGVVSLGSDQVTRTYSLHVQKQAGTVAIPLQVCVQLPAGATVVGSIPVGDTTNGVWCVEKNLRTDFGLQVDFSLP